MSSKSRETTKTAHVMNLLRKNSLSAQPTEEESVPSTLQTTDQPVAVTKHTPSKHPIIASLNEEAIVAQEIKGVLEQELEKSEQLAKASPTEPLRQAAEQEEPLLDAVHSEKAESGLAAEESAEKPQAERRGEEVDEARAEPIVAETPQPQVPADDAAPQPADIDCYNVMQVMVEDGAAKYMKMFGLCLCPRCRADVKAIALNNLQPKYVVMQSGEYIPRITVYERQFSSTVTAQILRACNLVAENPRHDVL